MGLATITAGIIIRFMNCNVEGNGIRDSAAAAHLISQVQFNGLVSYAFLLNTAVPERVIECTRVALCFTRGRPLLVLIFVRRRQD